MKKPINDEVFWGQRLASAINRGEPHRAVYEITSDKMAEIDKAHRVILHEIIQPGSFILDAGCGFGRIIPLLPERVSYHGVDLSPDFIRYARNLFPERIDRKFFNDNLISFFQRTEDKAYSHGIAVSMKAMIIREVSRKAWDEIEQQLRRTCKTVLLLEYSTNETDWEVILG